MAETPVSSDILQAPAHQLVQNALNHYYEQFFRMPIAAPGVEHINRLQPNATTEEQAAYLAHYTRQQCENGSAAILDYILTVQKNGRQLFDPNSMIIVTSMRNPQAPFHDFPNDAYTSYGFARDMDGYWHTFTGEYDSAGLISPSKDIQDLLDEIKRREGGVWPEGSYIEKNLSQYQDPPIVTELADTSGFHEMRVTFIASHLVTTTNEETGQLEQVTAQSFIKRDKPQNAGPNKKVRTVHFRRTEEVPKIRTIAV